MILIATVGRSGSSFLMKWLKECGVNIDTNSWFDKFNAGLEHKDVCSINNDLIANIIKGKDINLWYVRGRIADLKLEVYKDPQFLVHPDIIKNWHRVRKDINVIFLHRNPEEVVESCKRIPEWTGPTYRLFPEMIEEKNKNFLDTLEELGVDYMSFRFPDFLDTPMEVIEQISEWIELPEDALEIWKEVRE